MIPTFERFSAEQLKQQAKKDITWTKEMVEKEARRFQSAAKFIKNSPLAYYIAKEKGWYDDISKHFQEKRSWTIEELRTVAQKYNTREQFKKMDSGAYFYAYTNEILDEITPHMAAARPSVVKLIKIEFQKYKTKEELEEAEPTLYKISQQMGWIDKYYKGTQTSGRLARSKRDISKST